MQQQQTDRVNLLIELLAATLENVPLILTEKEDHMIRFGVETSLRSLINKTSHNAGATIMSNGLSAPSFPPITDFFGEAVGRTAMPDALIDSNPTLDEQQQFDKRIDDLYISLPGMKSETVVRDFTATEHESLVLRGVAKRAGVTDYEQGKITTAFVDDIKAAMLTKMKQEEFEEQENEKLQAQIQKLQQLDEDITVTDQHLTAFPQLVANGLRAGDLVKKSYLSELALNAHLQGAPPAGATAPVTPGAQAATDATNKPATTKKAAQADKSDNK